MDKEATFQIVAPNQNELMNKATGLIEQAERAVIASDSDLEKAADLVKFLRTLFKKAEKQRTDLTGPILATKTKIDAEYKKITIPVTNAIKSAERKMTAFMNKREALAQIERDKAIKEAEEKAIAEAEAAQATEGDAAADKVIEQVTSDIALVENTVIKTKVSGDYGATATSQKVRRWRVKDIRAIPMMFLMLDEPEIKTAVRNHKQRVDGLADEQGLKGKARDAYINEQMAAFQIDGLEFYFENKARVR